MKESIIQAKIIKRLTDDGYYVIKLIQTNKNGIPDLLALKEGVAMFIEVKSESAINNKNELQDYRKKELEKFGFKIYKTCDPEFCF